MVAAGASIPAATRAMGMAPRQWHAWRRSWRSGSATPAINRLMEELEKARGLALAQAQVRSLKDKPLDWLKNALGTRQPTRSAPLRKRKEAQLFNNQDQWVGLLNSLEPWPEARIAAATWLRDLQEPPA